MSWATKRRSRVPGRRSPTTGARWPGSAAGGGGQQGALTGAVGAHQERSPGAGNQNATSRGAQPLRYIAPAGPPPEPALIGSLLVLLVSTLGGGSLCQRSSRTRPPAPFASSQPSPTAARARLTDPATPRAAVSPQRQADSDRRDQIPNAPAGARFSQLAPQLANSGRCWDGGRDDLWPWAAGPGPSRTLFAFCWTI